MFGTSTGGRSTRRIGLALLATAATVGAGLVVTSATASAGPSHNPYGHVDSVRQVSTWNYRVSGWALDNDSTRPVTVDALIDGRKAALTSANDSTPAVPARYGKHAGGHGFTMVVRVPPGRHRICVNASNRGPGRFSHLNCKTVTHNNVPSGYLSSVRQISGGVAYYGAAWDPNTPNKPITVTMTANGVQQGGAHVANRKAHGGHGFAVNRHPLPEGPTQICVIAQNVRWGHDKTIGCKSITLDYDPVGAITALTQVPGGVRVSGWSTDPDEPNAAIAVSVYDGSKRLGSTTANAVGKTKNGHQFSATYQLAEGTHTICVNGTNVGPGKNAQLACKSITLDFSPTVKVTATRQTVHGVRVYGTAVDPDTSDPITTTLTLDGKAAGSSTANLGSAHHDFRVDLTAGAGQHTVCVTGINVDFGTHDSAPTCRTFSINHDPLGAFEHLSRPKGDDTHLVVSGWALDRGTTAPITVSATLDGSPATTGTANQNRPDIATKYPSFGADHGFSITIPADAGEHTVCLTAVNVGDGKDLSLGCELIIAVHPKPASAPQQVSAIAGYGGATVQWTAPASDGGAPPSSYVITSSPGNVVVKASGDDTTATVLGLKAHRNYKFSVVAVNVAGTSPSGVSPTVTTQSSPPPQTSPAPVSTSRYIRNIRTGSASEQATMRSEGATDAYYNPSGHGYLILLDIGGQDSYDGGVVLSATTRFVSYGALVADVKAYVDGYASKQKPSAPVTIAIGTNNDMDVTHAAGRDWANKVVDPIVSYVASRYPGMTIAGANDIEPGFRGNYAHTKSWLDGYLGATTAPFVFNGSADGCSWTAPNRHCNNGWTMGGLYRLAGGAAPTRIINLPQIYNTTMPRQWKYISLTGVNAGQPRINFGGTLTEWTACDQSGGGCGSITGNYAWQQLWNQLQSASQLKVNSLPYATDLRIDR
jgi:hypothetical protein